MSVSHTPHAPDASDRREHLVTLGEPDEVDQYGRRLHKVLLRELEETDGLDRSLVASGLEIHRVVDQGSEPVVWFRETGAPVPPTPVKRRLTGAELTARRLAKRAARGG
jgi:hypothetical protein